MLYSSKIMAKAYLVHLTSPQTWPPVNMFMEHFQLIFWWQFYGSPSKILWNQSENEILFKANFTKQH
jgi:hypothetical protein